MFQLNISEITIETTHRKILPWIVLIAGFLVLVFFRGPHILEFAHYYIGAKYFRELRYDGLYDAILAALCEIEPHDKILQAVPKIRNLESGGYVSSTDALDRFGKIKEQIWTEKRWGEFVHDIGFLRAMMEKGSSKEPLLHWRKILVDHGYNAPPTYTAYVSLLANSLRLNSLTIHILSFIDCILAIAIFIVVKKISGLRAMVLSFLFFLTSLDMLSYVTWAFLRFDWLLMLGLAFLAISKRRYSISGMSFGIAATLRLFPAAIAVLFGVIWAFSKSDDPGKWKNFSAFAKGFFRGTFYLLAISTAMAWIFMKIPPFSLWQSFIERISTHAETRIMLNGIGLQKIFEITGIYIPRFFIIALGLAIAVAVISILVRKQRNHVETAICSIFALPFIFYLSHYYYLMLLYVAALPCKNTRLLIIFLMAVNIVAYLAKLLGAQYVMVLQLECVAYSIALIVFPFVSYLAKENGKRSA